LQTVWNIPQFSTSQVCLSPLCNFSLFGFYGNLVAGGGCLGTASVAGGVQWWWYTGLGWDDGCSGFTMKQASLMRHWLCEALI